jgi:sulfatase modifying factor 1
MRNLGILIFVCAGVAVHAPDHCDTGISAVRRAPAAASLPVSRNAESTAGMVRIAGGEFWMGSDHPDMQDARPVHRMYVDPFWMDRTEVT